MEPALWTLAAVLIVSAGTLALSHLIALSLRVLDQLCAEHVKRMIRSR